MKDQNLLYKGVEGGFASVASAFVIESVEHMLPWLMVSAGVILTDLAFGVRKSYLLGERVRFSKAVRNTMGKMVTYFAFVLMVCMIDVAAAGGGHIEKWACLLVCFIEGCSIISNYLKPKGIEVDLAKAIALFASKVLRLDKGDVNGLFDRKEKGNGASR